MSYHRPGSLFGYSQCDLHVPEYLQEEFASFLPFLEKTIVYRQDNGLLLQEHGEREKLTSQLRGMFVSGFELKNGTIIIPLPLFYSELGLVCTKDYQFVEYTPAECFNEFVQFGVDARQQVNENLKASVIAETMKLLANRSSGYQMMVQTSHFVTKNLNDERLHTATNNKLFKRQAHTNDQLYGVELMNSN